MPIVKSEKFQDGPTDSMTLIFEERACYRRVRISTTDTSSIACSFIIQINLAFVIEKHVVYLDLLLSWLMFSQITKFTYLFWAYPTPVTLLTKAVAIHEYRENNGQEYLHTSCSLLWILLPYRVVLMLKVDANKDICNHFLWKNQVSLLSLEVPQFFLWSYPCL